VERTLSVVAEVAIEFEGFAPDAIVPSVDTFADVAGVLNPPEQLFDRRLVTVVGRADEVRVADLQLAPAIPMTNDTRSPRRRRYRAMQSAPIFS
jgi:hypothetical protein